MDQAVSDGVFPGGVLLAARGSQELFFKAAGFTSNFAGHPVERDTVFDLASLTKPLATTVAIMQLVRDKRVYLNFPISRTLSDLDCEGKRSITWQQLLCHTSGMPDYRPYYHKLLLLPPERRKEALHRLLISEPLIYLPGEKTVYSDLGFLILQWAIETVTGLELDQFVKEKVYTPLGVSGLFFNRHPDNSSIYAVTEKCPVRGLLSGVVHDENAYAIGGVAGHAGLFGTADAVLVLLNHLLSEYHGTSGQQFFGRGLVYRFFSCPPDADRTPGFDVPSSLNSSSGSYFTLGKSIGHLGFTGTSFWIDLQEGIIIILLTNRVHPTRKNEGIKSFRPLIHDALMRFIRAGYQS